MTKYVVTGAGGSIGSAVCEKLVNHNVEALTLVSLTESGLYNIERHLRAINEDTEIVGVLGSVVDMPLMVRTCKDADVIIHAAAHKHVPICEANPIAAIENNVRGTMNLLHAADLCGVGQFLLISTDKAVHPLSIMGRTKRVCEMIMAKNDGESIRTTVRFGNVMDSAGSVLPLWREQIASGCPITVTHPDCERYFMTIDDAVELIFGTLEMKKTGTFVFDMGEPVKMRDMAEDMAAEQGGWPINYIGLRPGEKLTEELHYGGRLLPTSHPAIFEVEPNGVSTKLVSLMSLLGASVCLKEQLAIKILKDMTT